MKAAPTTPLCIRVSHHLVRLMNFPLVVPTRLGSTVRRRGILSITSKTLISRSRCPSHCSVETLLSGGTRQPPPGGSLKTNALTASLPSRRAGLPTTVCWNALTTAGLFPGRVCAIASRNKLRAQQQRLPEGLA